jgi:hypothetical protein
MSQFRKEDFSDIQEADPRRIEELECTS